MGGDAKSSEIPGEICQSLEVSHWKPGVQTYICIANPEQLLSGIEGGANRRREVLGGGALCIRKAYKALFM